MLKLVGEKIGMSHFFSENGLMVPLTLLKIHEGTVIDLSVNEEENSCNLILAFEKVINSKKIKKPLLGVFRKKTPDSLFKKIKGSIIRNNSTLKIGDSININSVAKNGDRINVSAITIGKGFSGVMKRWNFSGLEASHGVSLSHRSHGSTGQRQDPGKTFKGKKMAGHMGVKRITTKNLEIISIDKEKSVIAIRGCVPGNSGQEVVVKIFKNL